MEGRLESILNLWIEQDGCLKSIIDCLTEDVIAMKHDHEACVLHRQKLEMLCILLKRESRSFLCHKNLSCASSSSSHIIDKCLLTLRNIEDGKDTCIPIICDVLCSSLFLLPNYLLREKLTLIMSNNKSQLGDLTEHLSSVCIDNKFMTLEVTKLGINLRIWETIIAFILDLRNNLFSSAEFDVPSTLLEIFDDVFNGLLLKVINFEHDVLTSQVLLCVIPKLVVVTDDNSLIRKIWDNIMCVFNDNECICQVTSHMFLILCTLSDLFIPYDNNSNYSYLVVENYDFWRILQYGIVSSDALIRKQALYLLKRSVERQSCTHSHLNASLSNNFFWWSEEKTHHFEKVWNNLYIILEVLEEKQMHLVEPVQPFLGSLVEACHKSLIHPSWIFCIVQRALGHECTTVVKWGVTCLSTQKLHVFMTDSLDFGFIFSSLVSALNSASLYAMNSNTNISLPKIVCDLRSFLVAIAEYQNQISKVIFTSILTSIVRVSWGPVALFYVVYALAAVPKCPVWNVDNIRMLKVFLIDAISTQVVHIRGAIQTFFIDTLINLADEKQLDIKNLAEILGCFRKKETLKRGTITWQKVVAWLKSFLTQKDAIKFAQESFFCVINGDLECEKQSAARMIILLSDAELISLNTQSNYSQYSLGSALHSVLQYFENCQERLYICPRKQDSCLEMLIALLEESKSMGDYDSTGQDIITLISSIIPEIFYSLKRNMFSASNLKCFDAVNLYIRSLHILSDEPRILSILIKHTVILQEASFSILSNENSTPVSKFFSIKVLSWILNLSKFICDQRAVLISDDSKFLIEKLLSFLENMFQNKPINQILVKSDHDVLLTRDLQTLWGKLVSEYLQASWFLLITFLELRGKFSIVGICFSFANRIWIEAGEALEVGGRGMLIPVMSVVQHILCQFRTANYNEEIKRFLKVCWNGIFELRKSELFWSALENFVKMIFQECLLEEEHLQKTLLMYAQELFVQGESVTGICNILLIQLQDIARGGEATIFEPFIDVLIDAVLFGPVHRRDRKIDDETCAFIRSLGERCCINKISSLSSDTEVRGRAIQLFLSFLNNAKSNDIIVISKVVHRLIEKDSQAARQKTRYFADSHHHRYRHRIMQVLLLLETALTEEEGKMLLSYTQHSLFTENHQPSIRYLQEWLLIRLMLKDSSTRSEIWSKLRMASETRPGSVCSFISIIYHIAMSLPRNNDLESFMDTGMREILPYTMAQHFNVRLFAQTSFVKLWEYSRKINFQDITKKYDIVYSGIIKSLHAPCCSKNVKKLEDFYYNTFHPIEHYSLQTIFYDLPRLTNVTHEEWIPHDVIRLCGNVNTVIPLLSKNSDLQYEHTPCAVHSDPTINDGDKTSNPEFGNIQKKIIPWRAMFPNPETIMSDAVLRRKQSTADEGLIVMASLIDRPPNLGGLSRTCEAFGVFQYVLGNIKYLEDKQFQVLSVTSERWVSISEVRPHDISDYLKAMKHEGYYIVGAEQTSNSVPLYEMKFPKRTVLLLGNEKEGIPVNLLPLLDICVEVPQQGVIRSLNVHVTGAIFIWEYSRQHNFSSKS